MSVKLFEPIQIREVKIRNRIFVSPMCQYSAQNGFVQDWHFVHLGSRAVGGAGLVIMEATGISPEGRITKGCTGLWSQEHADKLKPIVKFIQVQGAKAGIQIAHAGRKASCDLPWRGGKSLPNEDGGWTTTAPSAVAYGNYKAPLEMAEKDIQKVLEQFLLSTELAHNAGFDVLELHMAHGYLLNEFLSPLSNQRKDAYGGSLENRMRFPLEVARKVRARWPQEKPLFIRISATDWAEGGWDLEQSILFCKELKKIGVDFIDCSSGGIVSHAKIPVAPNYQVPFAEQIKKQVDILTGAVGLITEPLQAEEILENKKADAVLLARALLNDPYWPLHAAQRLQIKDIVPSQYLRAF